MNDFEDKTVYILDSYGLIYRCYFAFINHPLTNAEGKNVSAVFGFFRNLNIILSHYNPKYIIAAMDSRTPTFRHQMYKDYKITRAKTPEDLHSQIPVIEEILTALGIPLLRCDGFEADDLIATIAKKCAEKGRKCRILSGDKDLMQLVNDTAQILKPDANGAWKVVGKEGVKAEWGVMPEQLLDLLSLYGDTADNIPGVKGIGVKRAGMLLEQYGSLEGIYEHADEIKGSMGEKIRSGKENAFFSQKLIRLCYDVPLSEKDSIKPVNLDFASAAKLLLKYGLPSVAEQYEANSDVNNAEKNPAGSAVRDAAYGTIKNAAQAGKDPAEDGQAGNAGKTYKTQAQQDTDDVSPAMIPVQNKGDYRAVTNIKELSEFIDSVFEMKKNVLSFDCETDSLETHSAHMLGFSLCAEKGRAIYVPLAAQEALFDREFISKNDAFSQLERLFNDENITLVMHNGKFDYEILKTKISCRIADTMIAAWLLEPDRNGRNSYSLEFLAETKLGLKGIEYDDIVAKGQTFADVPLEKAVPYGAEDADFTFQLWQYFEGRLEKNNLTKLFWQTEMRLIPILAKMEMKGIHLDKNALNVYNEELIKQIHSAEQDIYKTVGHEFNIASTKQLQEVLFTELGLKPGKKTKTGFSTDTAVLEELAAWHPVPQKILDYRTLTKLQSTYVEALPKLADANSRVHTSFIQTGTATGRLSSRDPNLQNIPVRDEAGRKIRTAFTAVDKTVLISADYSQIELVVLAHLSGDKNMRKAFMEGTDIHRFTAALIFNVAPKDVSPEQRRLAKTINFGVIYGMSAFRLSNELKISRTQAQGFIDNYFSTFSAIQDFKTRVIEGAEKNGYVETIFGRKRPIPTINSRNKMEKSGAERIAVNTPIQGSAADIVKQAMIDVDDALERKNNGAHLLLQVHDELILECPDESHTIEDTISLVKDKMENAVKLSVPLKVSVEYGKNWGEFH
ncbi:DNA polymerase I [Treponema parvum]|uniref:DNA polymerase I n=1 Tax=Treponema parvum TaxID=138851 RepID=A0A975F2Z7_9SPIR|nr:DNA polymerase I [Treponema parvum]QTQ13579.1 DNA polymerase I [Treponema parvum]